MKNLNELQTKAKKELAIRELSRRKLLPFIEYNFVDYRANWHHKLLIEKLEAVERGEIKRLIVEMPPRHGKSEIVSVQFPAWFIGKNPDKAIITSCYASELATDFGGQTRNLINTREYQYIFDDIKLAEDSQAKNNWGISGHRGRYVATGVGGAITGKGADVLIIDDPFKNREDADSPVIREKVWKWYTSTARTRLSPNGAIVIVHTRWHDEDLIGKILQSENADNWERLRLPAIATEDEEFRLKGEPLWANQYTLENLMETKQDIGPYDWSALYQQDPVDTESQEFKREWFKYKTLDEVGKVNTRKFITIDTALSKGAKSDSTGVTRNYVDRENNWNIRSNRYRINSKELVDMIFLLHEEGFEKIGIEEGAYISAVEPFLKEEMQKRNKFPYVVTLKHGGIMKETRIRGLIPRYSSGSIFHIDKDCVDLEEELLRFPKATHDDCADSLAYQLQIAEPPFDNRQIYMQQMI
jgi:hypothetical protein